MNSYAFKVALTLLLAISCQSALAQAMYRIKPLGYLGGCKSSAPSAIGLNRADEVAGIACNANGDTHAFLWKNNGAPMMDLGPNEVGSFSAAAGISDSGLVAGNGNDSTGAYAFVTSGDGTPMRKTYSSAGASNVSAIALNDAGQVVGNFLTTGGSATHTFFWDSSHGSARVDLGTLNGATDTTGRAINASGQIAGVAYLAEGETHAFIWKNNGTPMIDLGTLGGLTSGACCINASGQVAGGSKVTNQLRVVHAFFWRNDGTPMQDLGALGGKRANSGASALNDSGQIAGTSNNYRLSNRAVVWLNDGTPMKVLGTLGGTESFPYDMNAWGQVTGWSYLAGDTITHAWVWRNDGTQMQDVNNLIDPTDPRKPYVTLTVGEFINDSGDILADGTDSRTGVEALYLLQGTVLTLSPRALAFGARPVNTTSAAHSVTVTNTSPKVVAITGIKLAGAGASEFTQTSNCGSSIVGKGSCTINVKFKPTSKGAKSATLSVNGGGGGLRVVTLAGTGT